MIIGIGNHAQRIYIPMFTKYSNQFPIELSVGVDLEGREKIIQDYLEKKGINLDVVLLENFDSQKEMPEKVQTILNKVVKEKNIEGVIISTDPLSHKVYAKWALSQGLHILMDKPISTRKNVVSKMKEANGIEDDYRELAEQYHKLQKNKNTIFSVNVQRRYEIGYLKVFELIREVSDKFNAPVTSIQAMHSDGVWIFPDEIVDQTCHPYNQGYGKNSHSGYHLFDIVWQFYISGKIAGKYADSAEVMTSFLSPDGFLTQFNQTDYIKYFGKQFSLLKQRDENELMVKFKTYGEIDSFSLIRLLNNNMNICNININLLHNGFSRRAWMNPGKDLYKGNGRVKHQSYIIQQGPFQCIQIHNYQVNDKQDKLSSNEYKLGGSNHFDIYVFRNNEMFGRNETPLKTLTLKDLAGENSLDDSRLYHETAKDSVIIEYIKFVRGEVKKDDLRSNITSHEIPVKIMSSIYKSHIKQRVGRNPIVRFRISD